MSAGSICLHSLIAHLLLQLGHLRGMSVQVAPAPGEMSRGSWLDPNVFTDIAFETDCGLSGLEERHVYVTSISGAVYQVLQSLSMAVQHCVRSLFACDTFHGLTKHVPLPPAAA